MTRGLILISVATLAPVGALAEVSNSDAPKPDLPKLKAPEPDDDDYGRPWFIVKAGIGIPNLVNAHVEVFVDRNWTVELGVGAGLLPMGFESSIRRRPEATCWDCDGDNSFSIGYGLDTLFAGTEGPSGGVAILMTASVDVMYIHRFAKHVGLMVGSRAGIGLTTELGTGRAWWKLEPGLNIILLQAGLAF